MSSFSSVGFRSVVIAGLAIVALFLATPFSLAHADTYPQRVSVASDGTQGNNESSIYDGKPSVSADGRYVAFSSSASNLVQGDTNSQVDIFVHDTVTGSTTRVSVASDGTQGNGNAGYPSISADSRYIAFQSSAYNLVPGDTNNAYDVFVHDMLTGSTTLVSVASDGTQGNGFSYAPFISAGGRYVAFLSSAPNLVAGDTNGAYDVFVHDMLTGSTTRVSVASDGSQANGYSNNLTPISADGRYVAFASVASNLVPGDTNGTNDIFIHDMITGSTTRISVATDGSQVNGHSYGPSISSDGRYIAFHSTASDLVSGDSNGTYDVFMHDIMTGSTTRISVASDGTQGNNYSFFPSMSADGRYVTFHSQASNLVPGDTNSVYDVFVHDMLTGSTTRVSVASDGTQGSYSELASISADGRYVTFNSNASNFVAGDTNGVTDIFLTRNPLFVPFVITTDSLLPSGTGGSPYSTTLQSSGGTAPITWSVVGGSLPAGFLLDSTTGVIYGTPTAVGTFGFTAQALDASGQTDSRTFTLVVLSPVSITTSFLPDATVGAGYLTTLTATSSASPSTPFTWAITAGSLPPGVSIDSSSGVISGTPTATSTSGFTIQVTDASGYTAAKDFSIVVNPTPVITTTTLPDGTKTIAYSEFLAATGGTAPLTWTIATGTLPAGLTLNSSTGEISGTPTVSSASTFTVRVTDVYGATTYQMMSLRINIVTNITTHHLLDGKVGSAYSQQFNAIGGTLPYTWSVTSGTLPAGLTSDSAGNLTGTPTTAGTYYFTVQVMEANGYTDAADFDVTIKP